MKATELRIGNYLDPYHNWKGPVQVTSISESKIITTPNSIGAVNDSFLKPIPLTEEWLVKFGFDIKKSPNHKEWIEIFKGEFYMQKVEGDDFWSTCIEYDHDASFKSGHIQYVHQLQNLYFALTGEELTLPD